MKRPRMLTAKDIMTRRLATLRPETSVTEAIGVLLRRDISGVPVVDGERALVGILSERDCLRVIAVGQYSSVDHDTTRAVAEFMSEPRYTVPPEVGIYSLADFFLTHHERRLPVIEGGKLIGLVSRRDVLRGIRKMIRQGNVPASVEERGPRLYPSATDASPGALGKRPD